MATNQAIMTADALLALGDIGPCELIEGDLVRISPGGPEHGMVAMAIGSLLATHVRSHKLGWVMSEAGFRIARDPDTVRAPDAAFVSADRLSSLPRRGFFEGAPDLAVEVISPEDRWSEVTRKAQSWLEAGARAVWVIDPPNRTVTVCGASRGVDVLHGDDPLDAGDVVPGSCVRISEIFADLPA